MKYYLSAFCLINVITAELDISPSTNIQTGTPSSTVRCQPTTASGVTDVYRLDISRQREGVNTEQSLGTIQVGKQPELGPGLTSPKYTVSGSLTATDAASTSFLQIVIQDPNCNDKGEYICRVSGANSAGFLSPEKRTNVTVQENPSNLFMNVVPRSKYELNASISLICNGNVGNPGQTWQWQTRRFPASTQWIRYTDETDIVTDPVTPSSETSCSYRQQTVLNYRVKAQDNGLEIRCILDNREEFSKTFTVYLVAKSAQLDISPSTNIQAGTPSLTVRCQETTASSVTVVFQLDILRQREGVSTEKVLGTIEFLKQPKLGPGLTSPKYTTSGSLSMDAVSTSFLQIVIQDPNCNDKGEYICRITEGNRRVSLTSEKRTNVTVQENPSNVGMNVVPLRAKYELNASISMVCNGNVGNPAQTWQWQTRRFPGTHWSSYTDEADIVTDPVNPPSGTSCSYRQKTVLTYRVKSQDDGLEIRCILDNREEFSQNFTVYLDVPSAQLDISPSTNIQTGAPSLTVRCQPTNASGVTDVYRLDISRLREGVNTEQSLGTIQVGKQPQLEPGLTSPKYTVSGSLTAIGAVSTSFLQIVIQDPNCNDKGEYICRVTGEISGGSLTSEKRTNVTVQENPSNLVMNVVPFRAKYELNASISMTCNGNVGNPTQTWQWQTRRFPASTQWIRYTDEADIVTDPVTPPSGTSCSYRQQTVLNYRVKAQDDGLEIRCILDNREEFSQNFTVYLVEKPVTSPPNVPSSQLDIIPSTNIQAGTPSLTVRCQPTSGVTSVYRLDISRLREGVNTEQSLGTIQVGQQPELGPGLFSPKYTVSGSLTSTNAVSTSFLQIVIQDPNCNDNGEYICRVTGGNSKGFITTEFRTNVTVQENPSNLGMNVVPLRLQYDLDASISMTCNGNVGNPAQTWQWQTRRFPASTQWIRYTDEADIVTDPVTPPSGTSCSYRQKTVLTYRVKSQDDGLEIRCILDNREEFSQNFTVYLEEKYVTSPPRSESLKFTYQMPTAEKTYLQFLCTATESVAMIGFSKNDMIIAKYDVNTKKKTKTEDFATINYFPGNKMLQLKYDKPDCNQYGKYHCVADDKVSSDFTFGNKTFPVDLEMVVDPEKSAYGERDTITLTCSGKLGNPPKEWSWNTRVKSDNSTVDWNSYAVGITTQERQKSGCQFIQKTSLSYTVKNDDDGRQFQCTLGDSFSKSFEIKTSSDSMKLESLVPVYFCIIAFFNLL